MATIRKNLLASGVGAPVSKAPDKEGAWIDVQKKTLGSMKSGGKIKKGCMKCGGKMKKKK